MNTTATQGAIVDTKLASEIVVGDEIVLPSGSVNTVTKILAEGAMIIIIAESARGGSSLRKRANTKLQVLAR